MLAKRPSGAPPPHAVHVERKHVVQQIVAGRDGSEHLAHRARGGGLVACALGRCPYNGGFVEIRHENAIEDQRCFLLLRLALFSLVLPGLALFSCLTSRST